MTNATPAEKESKWWDDHADEIHVWGIAGSIEWRSGQDCCLAMVRETLGDAEPAALVAENGPERLVAAQRWRIPGNVLDLGCGLGRLLLPLAVENPHADFHGVDCSEAMLGQLARAAEWAAIRNLRLHAGDGRNLPTTLWQEQQFRSAYSVLMFQHIPPEAQQRYTHEVGRLLQPGGRFVVQIDARDYTGGSFLSYATNPDELRLWAEQVGLAQLGPLEFDACHDGWAWLLFEKIS